MDPRPDCITVQDPSGSDGTAPTIAPIVATTCPHQSLAIETDVVGTMDPMPKNTIIKLRVATEDVDAWKRAAALERMSLSDWIRRRCHGLSAIAPTLPAVATPAPPTPSLRGEPTAADEVRQELSSLSDGQADAVLSFIQDGKRRREREAKQDAKAKQRAAKRSTSKRGGK